MKLSTRLLLPLLATVVAVMVAYGWWARVQRESSVIAESRREVAAYATALGLALERAVRQPETGDVQEVIDRLTREPAVYAVLVYDGEGRPLFVSDPLGSDPAPPDEILRSVLASGESATLDRDLDGEEVVSVVRALRDDDGSVVGALEVAQPLAFATAELARIRQRFVLNTLTLVAALGLLLTLLVRRTVSRPLGRFVEAVRAFGRGDFGHRLEAGAGTGELAEVAAELNRMAARLEEARAELIERTGQQLDLERQLRHTEKMAAVGRLAAGLAHEIGAPLHVIRGRAERLQNRGPTGEVLERNLDIIVGQIDRIALIVKNLTEYARRREPRLVEADLEDVVEGVAEFLDGEAGRAGARIEVKAPPDGLTARADPDLLHQVALNLALNALHAVEGVDGPRVVTLELTRREADGAAVIDVSDTGPGVPAEARDRLFDPFFTTKAGSRGTGLGLAVARGIVEDHGGTVELHGGQEDGGARFRVILPGRGPSAVRPADSRRSPGAGPGAPASGMPGTLPAAESGAHAAAPSPGAAEEEDHASD